VEILDDVHQEPTVLAEGSWGELVGSDGQEARKEVRKTPGVATVELLRMGAMVTMDFREDRVRIYVDGDGNVAMPPARG